MNSFSDAEQGVPQQTSDYSNRSGSGGEAMERRFEPRLSKRVYRLLRYGDERGQYGHDEFRVACAIIAEAARAGHDVEQLLGLLATPENAGGEWYRDRRAKYGAHSSDRQVQRLFDHSVHKLRRGLGDATEVRMQLSRIQCAAAAHPWSGRTAGTLYRLFRAHTAIAMNVGSLTYTASTRQLGELAGTSRVTAQARNRDLVAARMLRRLEPARGARAPKWKILEAPWDQHDPVVPTQGQSTTGSILHPAFRFGTGLDARVWAALDQNDPATTAELAAVLRLRADTMRRKLRNLLRVQLAVRDGDGYWRRTGDIAVLDDIAQRTGMADRSERQRQRHLLERAEFRRYARQAMPTGVVR